MKAIIVEDEPKAIELLRGYLEHFKSIELVGTFRNGLKAFEFMNKEKVDLVFLDINMPHLSGISLSKMLDKNTQIIFTTAHAEHAVESYEVQAVDYLLKPISLERFTKALSKVLSTVAPVENTEAFLSIKSGSKLYRLRADEILFLQKDGNYMVYHTMDQKIMARESVAESIAILPHHFMQVHKSYIINIQKISFIEREEVDIKGNKIPLGAMYKENLDKIAKGT
jgi:DNA-binding LytR/AlgR family response regulator